MLNQIVISVVVYVVLAWNLAAGKKLDEDAEYLCEFAPGYTVGNRTRELECCNMTKKMQFRRWSSGSKYLSTYLEKLQTWKCPQFGHECQYPTFDFNNFTNLVYKRFCNRKELEKQCLGELRTATQSQNKNVAASAEWDEMLKLLNIRDLTDEQLLIPCLQIAMYDIDLTSISYYHEIIEPVTPFCSFTWCGFDQYLVKTKKISSWTCMPKSCQANIITIMVVVGILGVATFVCNATVIAVLSQNCNLQNGQAVYRLSLAFADILVGIIVFPTFITTLQKYFLLPNETGQLKNVTGYRLVNGTANLSHLSTVEAFEPPSFYRTRFSQSYLNTVGFFTVLSFFVSVNTLMAASVDRFVAVYRPLRYKTSSAMFGARIAVALIWIIALVFSTIPFYVHSMRYNVVASVLISSAGRRVVIIYTLAFIVPLLVVWVLTITTFVVARRRVSMTSSAQSHSNASDLELRLLQTLGVMVGIFSLCLLPSIVVLVAGLFLPDIYYNRPLQLNQTTASNFTSIEVIAVILLASNSLWNCFIYSARDQSFRDATKLLYARIAHAFKIDNVWKGFCLKLNRNRNGLLRPDSQNSTTATTNDLQDTCFYNVNADETVFPNPAVQLEAK